MVACGGDDVGTAVEQGLHSVDRNPPLEVGNLSLPEVDASGRATPFSFRAPEGELLVVYFGYTHCPDLCPTTLADLKMTRQLLGEQGDRFTVAFATVDPERDTPEILNAYLRGFFPDGHPLRTTDEEELATVEKGFLASSSIRKRGEEVQVSHTASTYVIDSSGTVVAEWLFGTTPDLMASDLRLLFDRLDAASRAGT